MSSTTPQILNDNRITNSGNVVNSYNTVVADKRSQILDWLSPLEPNKRRQDIRTHRLDDGVGDSFLAAKEFLEWRNAEDGSTNSVLFCSGGPGGGKTYL